MCFIAKMYWLFFDISSLIDDLVEKKDMSMVYIHIKQQMPNLLECSLPYTTTAGTEQHINVYCIVKYYALYEGAGVVFGIFYFLTITSFLLHYITLITLVFKTQRV